MFKKIFKGPVSAQGDSASFVDENGKTSNQELHNQMLDELPKGLGVNFAREFCTELSPESMNVLFPEGFEE